MFTPLWRMATASTAAFGFVLSVSVVAMRIVGVDVSTCGCFGSIRLDLVPHALLIGALQVLVLAAWLAPAARATASSSAS